MNATTGAIVAVGILAGVALLAGGGYAIKSSMDDSASLAANNGLSQSDIAAQQASDAATARQDMALANQYDPTLPAPSYSPALAAQRQSYLNQAAQRTAAMSTVPDVQFSAPDTERYEVIED